MGRIPTNQRTLNVLHAHERDWTHWTDDGTIKSIMNRHRDWDIITQNALYCSKRLSALMLCKTLCTNPKDKKTATSRLEHMMAYVQTRLKPFAFSDSGPRF